MGCSCKLWGEYPCSGDLQTSVDSGETGLGSAWGAFLNSGCIRPRGPCDRKNSIPIEIFNPDLKFSISIEIFCLDRKFQSTKNFYLRGPPGVAEKGSIEIFNPRSIARNFPSRSPRSNFFDLWALWGADYREGDEDSGFSVFRLQRFTESPGPLH